MGFNLGFKGLIPRPTPKPDDQVMSLSGSSLKTCPAQVALPAPGQLPA